MALLCCHSMRYFLWRQTTFFLWFFSSWLGAFSWLIFTCFLPYCFILSPGLHPEVSDTHWSRSAETPKQKVGPRAAAEVASSALDGWFWASAIGGGVVVEPGATDARFVATVVTHVIQSEGDSMFTVWLYIVHLSWPQALDFFLKLINLFCQPMQGLWYFCITCFKKNFI